MKSNISRAKLLGHNQPSSEIKDLGGLEAEIYDITLVLEAFGRLMWDSVQRCPLHGEGPMAASERRNNLFDFEVLRRSLPLIQHAHPP